MWNTLECFELGNKIQKQYGKKKEKRNTEGVGVGEIIYLRALQASDFATI